MIVARLDGRLGNQMFVYATAYALAKEHNQDLAIYKFEYDTLYRRDGYGLDQLCLVPCRKYLGIPSILYADTIKKTILRLLRIKRRKAFESHTIDVINEKVGQEVCLNESKRVHLLQGYWQSQIYFDKYRNELLKQMIPNFILSNLGQRLILEMQQGQYPVSIHIRRGDYVKIGWDIGLDYYEKAMSYIAKQHNECKFYVFSDDIKWVKENLPIEGYQVVFVERDKPVKPFEDIWLMTKCRGNVIANSSFSWWGAYLNQNDNKIVVAPKEIYKTIRDLSEDWIVI